MQGAYEMTSVSSSTLKPGHGMLDCGATASAAQEAAVQGLISPVLTYDKSAEWRLTNPLARTFAVGMDGGEEPCIK